VEDRLGCRIGCGYRSETIRPWGEPGFNLVARDVLGRGSEKQRLSEKLKKAARDSDAENGKNQSAESGWGEKKIRKKNMSQFRHSI